MLGAVEQELSVNRQGGSYAQALSGPVVDLIGHRIEPLLAVDGQVGSLGQVLPEQAVHVLVGAPLPRAVRVAEVHRDARAFAQLLVHRHLPPLVVRHALAHRCGNAQELVREGLQHVGRTRGLELGEFDQHHQAAGALDQGAHRAGVGRTLDEVALPMTGELPVFNLRWAQVDAHHVGNLATPVLALAARHTLVVGMAQCGDEFALELAHGLGIDAVVDGLV